MADDLAGDPAPLSDPVGRSGSSGSGTPADTDECHPDWAPLMEHIDALKLLGLDKDDPDVMRLTESWGAIVGLGSGGRGSSRPWYYVIHPDLGRYWIADGSEKPEW